MVPTKDALSRLNSDAVTTATTLHFAQSLFPLAGAALGSLATLGRFSF